MRQNLYDYCLEHHRIDLLQEWDTDANLPLTPKTISYGSSRKITWLCAHGHRWEAKLFTRTTAQSGCPVCAGKQIVAGENDLQTLFPAVGAQWHPTKNDGLRPETVSPYSHRRVWWLCPSCGYTWRTSVKSRTGPNGTGCPACSNRAVFPGVNDLATVYPALAAEWHPEKNGTLTPQQVVCGSTRAVWWQCRTCGHVWRAEISTRVRGKGCPLCANRTVVAGINDLSTRYPQIAAEWHPTKNGSLTPTAVAAQSNRAVWWQCERGHSYQARISSRTVNSSDCPYCTGKRVLAGFNDLAAREPEIAAQWHPTRNGNLTPQEVTAGSAKRVWWQCPVCGHTWRAAVYSRTGSRRTGCPACAGRVSPQKRQRYAAMVAERAADPFSDENDA